MRQSYGLHKNNKKFEGLIGVAGNRSGIRALIMSTKPR